MTETMNISLADYVYKQIHLEMERENMKVRSPFVEELIRKGLVMHYFEKRNPDLNYQQILEMLQSEVIA